MANNGFDVKWAAPQVADWLNSEYPTSNLAPKFEGLSGGDMMGYSLEDLIAITNVALGRALFNKLHPTAPPPGSQAGPSGSGAGLVTVTVEYKTGEKKTFANLESNMHVETLKSRILQERRLPLPTSYVLLTKSGIASQIDPTRTLAEESLDHGVISADILVAGVIPKIPTSELIKRIRMGNYSSWGEARGIPVEVKEARDEANKGKWNDDFGQDFCAISNFVSVRWFDGEWQPGYFIMGITDNGTVQGFTYNQADDLMQSTQSALRNYLSPNDHVRLRVEQVGETYIVLAEIPPTIRMCTWRAKAYSLLGDGSRVLDQNNTLLYKFPYPTDVSADLSSSNSYDNKLVIAYSQYTRDGLQSLSATDYLTRTGLKGTITARVLFGDIKTKVAFYNHAGQIVTSVEEPGLFSLFSGNLIDRIRTWGSQPQFVISGLQRVVRLPYPVQALREALVNAVVHGLYANMQSNIDYLVVHVYPTRIEIRNRCNSAAKPYSLVWFSNLSVPANPFLMNTLRKCRDEQGKPMFAEAFGMGKRLIISSCVMHGDPAPTISVDSVTQQEFDYWWTVTLKNEFRMHPNVLALIRQLFNISTSDPTAATTTNSNQSTTDANTSITSTITNNASSTQDANTIYTKAAVDTDKTAMAITLLSWIGEAKANVVRKASNNYGITMKEILQAPVSPVIEQQGKLQAAPWVNQVCSGELWLTAYKEVDENPMLVAKVYTELMEQQTRITLAHNKATAEKDEQRANRAAEHNKKGKDNVKTKSERNGH